MKQKHSLKIFLLLLLATAIAGGTYFLKNGKKKEARWQKITVRKGAVEKTISTTGTVEPQNRLEIKAAISGRIEDVLAKEGDRVKKGQILIWMSSTERAALLDAARAQGATELSHWEGAYKPTPLVAPMDGVIIARNMEPGQTLTTADIPLVMANHLIVKAQVDETDIGSVRNGMATQVTLDAYPGKTIPARVAHIAYEATTVNNVTIYNVDVIPESVPAFMRSGMSANINFVLAQKKNALLIPEEAVHYEPEATFVFVPAEDAKQHPIRREVSLGISNGTDIEVTDGLAEGDTILIQDIQSLLAASNGGQGRNPFMPFGRGGGGGSGGSSRKRNN